MAETSELEATIPIVRPIVAFEDNLRPAKLMLHVYRLLDCQDQIVTDASFVERLRDLVRASATEDLMVVQNEIFLCLIRERAEIPKATLKNATLSHLLRQAIVASCTALDTFLPTLLRLYLPKVIRFKGRDVVGQDTTVRDYFQELKFSLDDVLRLLPDPNAPLFISNKLLGLASFKYLSSRNGVHVVGTLLGITKPWEAIANHLSHDRKELIRLLDETVRRRNDIVHRADRPQNSPDGAQQVITYVQAKQGVDTIEHVCLALNELVEIRMRELEDLSRGNQTDGTG